MKRVVRAALRRHKEAGHYIVVEENGRIVHVKAEDIVIPEEPEADESGPS